MTRTRPPRILAIDPGTRHMGVAVLDGGRLVHAGVREVERHRSPHETLRSARLAVIRLLKDFRPDLLAVEKTFVGRNRNAALLNVLGDEIRDLGRIFRVRLLAFAPSTVKRAVCGNGRATKRQVAEAVASRYPQLRRHLAPATKSRERYWSNLFDAVAVGIVARDRKAPRDRPRRQGG